MPFLTLDFQAVRDAILRDILNQRPDANVAADGDYAVRANATGAAVEGLYQHQQWIVRQLFPDTADPDYLERHAALRKLTLKPATSATGSVSFGGVVGSPVPIGTEVKTSGGIAYLTTAAGEIGVGGTVTLAAQAVVAGATGNQAAATALALTAAPSGVLSAASVVGMTGGTDVETHVSLLARLLFVLRNPPCGGALHDYYTWAMNVAGVTRAYPYANRRGNGTVDVVILTEGGLPSAPLVEAAQAYIDTQRSATADLLVFGPTAVAVDVAGTLTRASGYTLATVGAAIDATLAAYFATLKPGDTVYLNKIRSLISETPGVVDFVITSPVTNVTTLVDATHVEMPVLGTTVWS